MNKTFKLICALLLLTLAGRSALATTMTVSLSTGVSSSGTPLPNGTSDPRWTQVKLPSGIIMSPKTESSTACTVTYPNSSAAVKWITPFVQPNGSGSGGDAGDYVFRMTFMGPCKAATAASMFFNSIGADDQLTKITVNGTPHAISGIGSSCVSNFTLTLGAGEILANTTNVIEVTVKNVITCIGMQLQGALTITYPTTALNPVIAVSPWICTPAPATINGTLSTGNIGSYYWQVDVCDAAGNTFGGPQWSSGWVNGTPNSFNFLQVQNYMGCNPIYYYKVLLVITDYCTGQTASTTKIFRIKCGPNVVLKGSTSSVCLGSMGSIMASLSGGGVSISNCTMQIYNTSNNALVYSGPMGASVGVWPSVTTTYLVSVTDNSTGCVTNVYWTMSVLKCKRTWDPVIIKDPKFVGIIANPTDPDEGNDPGFGSAWFVEELDPAEYAADPMCDNMYVVKNPECWAAVSPGDKNTFQGFDGNAGYTGEVTTLPCPSGDGMFVYDHLYRITRGTWSDAEPWDEYTLLISVSDDGTYGKAARAMVTPVSSPGFSHLKPAAVQKQAKANASDFSIAPNPGTGLFTINATLATGTGIDVYDMLGAKVKTITWDGAAQQFDLSAFKKGIYFMQVLTPEGRTTKKLILE